MRIIHFARRGAPILVATLFVPGTLLAQGAAPAASGTGEPLYKVVDGYKVDPETMKGFRAWRAAACDRCHGANQEGLVGPSLVQSLKTLSKDDFKTSPIVMENLDHLYAYLKGRSNGDITRAKVEEIKP